MHRPRSALCKLLTGAWMELPGQAFLVAVQLGWNLAQQAASARTGMPRPPAGPPPLALQLRRDRLRQNRVQPQSMSSVGDGGVHIWGDTGRWRTVPRDAGASSRDRTRSRPCPTPTRPIGAAAPKGEVGGVGSLAIPPPGRHDKGLRHPRVLLMPISRYRHTRTGSNCRRQRRMSAGVWAHFCGTMQGVPRPHTQE